MWPFDTLYSLYSVGFFSFFCLFYVSLIIVKYFIDSFFFFAFHQSSLNISLDLFLGNFL